MAKKENKTERSSRRKQRRAEVTKARQRRNLLLLVPAVIVLGALGFLLFRQLSPIDGVVNYAGQDRSHDTEAVYPLTPLPPVGGAHQPIWQNCGVYLQPLEVALALHSMEHGAVWIAYQPELPAEEIEMLRVKAREQPLVLLAPYPGLASPVVATAWEVQLQLESAEDSRLDSFIGRYRGQGPEAGATCSGGVGTPVG